MRQTFKHKVFFACALALEDEEVDIDFLANTGPKRAGRNDFNGK